MLEVGTRVGDDLAGVRAAIRQAVHAGRRGDLPFGAVLADDQGAVVARAGNQVLTDGDLTAHAELLVLRCGLMGTRPAAAAGWTLYASAAPCPMCAGAVHWSGIGRLVFGASANRVVELTGGPTRSPALPFPCEQILAASPRSIEVVGPVLEGEASIALRENWPG
jgi:tRNA(Arg) A34 adenosine deaminase TadA